VKNLLPTAKDLKEAAPAIARGTLLGSLARHPAGGGALLAAFASYSMEKKIAA